MAEPPPPQYARRETPSHLGDVGTPYHVREKTGKARDSARFGALIAGAIFLFFPPSERELEQVASDCQAIDADTRRFSSPLLDITYGKGLCTCKSKLLRMSSPP